MSPEEIDEVVSSWQLAASRPEALQVALADRLPGLPRTRASRARWIVRAVSNLSRMLDHPATFALAATDLLAERLPVHIEELAVDRDALLGALEELQGPLTPESLHSWELAIGLFGELVATACLDPFCRMEPSSARATARAQATGEVACH